MTTCVISRAREALSDYNVKEKTDHVKKHPLHFSAMDYARATKQNQNGTRQAQNETRQLVQGFFVRKVNLESQLNFSLHIRFLHHSRLHWIQIATGGNGQIHIERLLGIQLCTRLLLAPSDYYWIYFQYLDANVAPFFEIFF